MTEPDVFDSSSDPFRPPADSVEVCCLHCGQTYQSDEIVWETKQYPDGITRSFWVCPIEGCSGAGFGFDILPTDPNYRDEHGGWVDDDDDDLDDNDDLDGDESELDDEAMKYNHEWDPADDSDPEFPVRDPDDTDSDIPF